MLESLGLLKNIPKSVSSRSVSSRTYADNNSDSDYEED
jgi:hypothetical protein